METYTLKLDDVEARTDGNVKLDMWILSADETPTSLHKDVLIPYTAIEIALDLPTTGAKAAAIKAAIWEYRNNREPVVEDLSNWEFSLFAAAVGSMNEMVALREFITDVLHLTFPFKFTITG